MCVIVGCIEKRDVYPAFIKSPKRWEHRGYGSAGIALIDIGRRLSITPNTPNYASRQQTLQQQGFIFSRSSDTAFLILLFEYFRISHHLDLFFVFNCTETAENIRLSAPLIHQNLPAVCRDRQGGQGQTMETSLANNGNILPKQWRHLWKRVTRVFLV